MIPQGALSAARNHKNILFFLDSRKRSVLYGFPSREHCYLIIFKRLVELTNTVNTHWRGVIQEEDVKKFVKKLKLATKEKPGTFLLPLLHLICRSSLGVAEDEEDVNNDNVHLICPFHLSEPHVVSRGTFLLLELG